MIVQIILDKPHAHFTNLDVISGKVFLRTPNPTNVSSIVVKLEGESRTRLLAATRPDRPDRQRPVLEVHKILYKTDVVWPANQTVHDVANSKASYSLNAGHYEYPFQFKVPLNNSCITANSLATNVNFTGLALEVARTPTQHVKQTLPPTLSGFPGEAEIRYFVKVTVNRPQFFKENPRAFANFNFLPIEPPRTQSDGEAYARRTHQFLENIPGTPATQRKKSFFGSKDNATGLGDITTPPASSSTTPRFIVDARLPNPAVLTCAKDLPLKILVKNMSDRMKNVYLQMLQIELIGYTKVRAHEVQRTESNSWIIASMSNMNIPIGSPADPEGTETPINPEYWSDKPLPKTIAPSFTTCNLSRFYELEVRVGLGYGTYEHGRDQLVVLPLRLPVKVFSGIEPPKALVDATVAAESGKGKAPAGTLKPETQAQAPQTPVSSSGVGGNQAVPPPQGAPTELVPPYEDAPPSYEDAIGQELPPINGYRVNDCSARYPKTQLIRLCDEF